MPTAPDIALRIQPPAPTLRHLISAYHEVSIAADEPIVDYGVPEWGSLRIILDGGFSFQTPEDAWVEAPMGFAVGPTSRPMGFRIGRVRMIGIGLLPEGFARFWNADLGKIFDRWCPLEAVMGEESGALRTLVENAIDFDQRVAALDGYFLGLLTSSKPLAAHRQLATLHALLNRPDICRTEQLAESVNMAASSLSAFCKRHFGFPPKLLLRRQRFLRMLDALHARPYRDWPDYIDPQYADQSHMIRDFHYFLGMTPSQYLDLPRPIQQLSAAHRREALGSTLQGLD